MRGRGARIAASARGLVGARFRLQGRDPQIGLDCVGAAAAAAGIPKEKLRSDYGLRGVSLADIEHELGALGLRRMEADEAEAGDVLVMTAGPAQLHLAIMTESGFVHADAGLRKVVERPGPPPWPVTGVWRVEED